MLYKVLTFLLLFITSVVNLATYLTIKKQPSEYKYLDLPEEFNEIKSGDTINVYQSNDTIFIRFIPRNYSCNNKTIVTF